MYNRDHFFLTWPELKKDKSWILESTKYSPDNSDLLHDLDIEGEQQFGIFWIGPVLLGNSRPLVSEHSLVVIMNYDEITKPSPAWEISFSNYTDTDIDMK